MRSPHTHGKRSVLTCSNFSSTHICLWWIITPNSLLCAALAEVQHLDSAYRTWNLFKRFCAEYGIKATTSSPTYPQSNGQSERCVQTVKNLLIKSLRSGEDANIALLNYRSTPISNAIPSPAQLLMSRNIRTLLPTPPRFLKPQSMDNEQIKTELQQRQTMQKMQFDKHAQHDTRSECTFVW